MVCLQANNKTGRVRLRGTSKREYLCNNVVALKQSDDHQAEDGAAFTVKFEKSRGVRGPAVASFAASLTEDEDGDLVWALQASKETKTSQVIELHEEGMGVREIARTLQMNPGTVSRYLKGRVLPVAPPRRGGGQQQHTYKSGEATPKATLIEKPLIERISQEAQGNTLGNTQSNTAQCSVLRDPLSKATPKETPKATPQQHPAQVEATRPKEHFVGTHPFLALNGAGKEEITNEVHK